MPRQNGDRFPDLAIDVVGGGTIHHVVKPPDIDKLRDLLATGWSDAGTDGVASRDVIDKSHARNIID